YEVAKSDINYQFEIVQNETGFRAGLTNYIPDIILSDYSLPSFDGLSAFKIKEEISPDTPFILISGTVGEENAVTIIKNGVTDYVLKDKLFTLNSKIIRALKEAEEKKEKNIAKNKRIQNEKRLTRAEKIAHIGNWELDFETGIALWSDEACRIYGLPLEENKHTFKSWLSFIHPEDLDFVLNKIKESETSLQRSSFAHRIVRKDGTIKHICSYSHFEMNAEGKPIGLYGVAQDVTEQKMIENEIKKKNIQLANLTSHLQGVREEERTTISREIHDELGQQLTALKMDIDWVKHKQNNPDRIVVAKLDEMLNMSSELINTMRRISSDLRPAIIDDLGLMAALEWKCNDFEEKMGIPCRFISSVKERKFENNFGINIYRILQETLTNISRHAAAKLVTVTVSENKTELLLEILDDGKGINNESIGKGKTLGIIGMKERATLLGGTLTIEGTKNKGTCTKLILPIKNEYTSS